MKQKKPYGLDLLQHQLLEFVASEYDWLKDEGPGDSPIEKLFFSAVWMQIRFGSTEFLHLLVAQDEVHEKKLMEIERVKWEMIVRPQVQIDNWRVDFLFHIYDWVNAPKFKAIIVECDGHDFHERTKEQAARDRSRDRQSLISGIPVIRFTGSELWRDPWGCATEFLDYATKEWGR